MRPRWAGVSRQEGGWFVAPARAAGCARQVGRLDFCVHREVSKPTKCSRRPRFVGWRPKTGRKPTKWRYPSRFVGWRPKPRRKPAMCQRLSRFVGFVGQALGRLLSAVGRHRTVTAAVPARGPALRGRDGRDARKRGPGGGTRPSETERRDATERDRAAGRDRARPCGGTRPSVTERRIATERRDAAERDRAAERNLDGTHAPVPT